MSFELEGLEYRWKPHNENYLNNQVWSDWDKLPKELNFIFGPPILQFRTKSEFTPGYFREKACPDNIEWFETRPEADYWQRVNITDAEDD